MINHWISPEVSVFPKKLFFSMYL